MGKNTSAGAPELFHVGAQPHLARNLYTRENCRIQAAHLSSSLSTAQFHCFFLHVSRHVDEIYGL